MEWSSMTVYQVKGDTLRYQAVHLTPMEIMDQISEDADEMTYLRFPMRITPIKDIWVNFKTSFYKESPKADALPDVMIWLGGVLCMTPAAKSLLEESLTPCGEFLPITIDNSPYYFFHCTTYGKEDPELTLNEYSDGILIGLKQLVFLESDIADKTVFLSERSQSSIIYCTNTFKTLYETHGLKGLIFDEKLLDPFIE